MEIAVNTPLTQASSIRKSNQAFHLLSWGLLNFVLFLPMTANSQVIADFGASSPRALKDLGDGNRLVVFSKSFGSPTTDSVYLETAIGYSDWSLMPIATKLFAAPGNWQFTSSITTADGLILNGNLNVSGSNSAILVRLTDAGEVIWCKNYTGASFRVALPSEDSIVAFTVAGPLLHRVVVGPDGMAIGSITISNTQNQPWSLTSGCVTDVPSEHMVAGAATYEGVNHAVVARIGPAGALWIKKYYVPIPGGVGYSGVSSIVRAEDGGYTCIINAMDNQIPGIYYYSYMMHFDDEGNVLWCRGSSLLGSAMSRRTLVQVEDGDYLAIQNYDLAANEIIRFSSTGEIIAVSYCQAPCNLFYLDYFMGTPFAGGYVRSGSKIAELGDYGAPCGRSIFTTGGGPPFVTVMTDPLTPTLATGPTVTTDTIPLADRPAELSATISCGATPVPSSPNADEYLRAFPVPSDGSIILKFGSEPTLRQVVELRDVQGRVVMHSFAPGEINIASLKPGIYDCLVVGTAMHVKIVKE